MRHQRLFLVAGLLVAALFVARLRALQPQSAALLITEFVYDSFGLDEEGEWIEVANVGETAVDLAAIKIGDEELLGGNEGMLRFPEDATLAPGAVIVIAQSAPGFRAQYGRNPDYEMRDEDAAVPDMRRYVRWAFGDVALGNGGDEVLLLGADNEILDTIGYGDSRSDAVPKAATVAAGQSLARVPATCDTDTAVEWQPQEVPTPGEITLEGECPVEAAPPTAAPLPPIGAIQGDGRQSPFVSQTVEFRGIVTGVYEDRNTRGATFYTVFVQDLPQQSDGDPATSDALAVFAGPNRPTVGLGDQVRVRGRVTEFYGFTEMDDSDLEMVVEARDVPLPEPVVINPPADNAAQASYFEPLEGMRVAFDGPALVVGPTYSGCGFAVVGPQSGATRVLRRSLEDPVGQVVPILHNSDVACGDFPDVKSGDTVAGIVGPLIYNFDQFKIVQQDPAALAVTTAPLPPRPSPPTADGDSFSVASFNVENYFDSRDDTGDDAEPKPGEAEIAVKRQKLAHALSETLGCPTFVGIQEVENAALLEALAAEAAAACGFTYEVSHRESADVRGIDVALLSDPRRVTVRQVQLRQTCAPLSTDIADPSLTCDFGEDPLFSRPPLQVDAAVDGAPVTILVNHFKSKRGGEAQTEPRRLAQAAHINALVADMLEQDARARIIVMGDFNDYDQSPALRRITETGQLTSVLQQVDEAQRYSFVFSGAAQLIDGLFVSPALAEKVTAVAILHVNADYPDAWGTDLSPQRIAYKSTDHDLPLAVFSLLEEATPQPPTATAPAAPPTPAPVAPAAPAAAWMPWLLGGVLLLLGGTAVFLWQRRG